MNARTLNLLGLGVVGVTGIAFLVLVPRLFELDVVLELTVYMIMAILALSLAFCELGASWTIGGAKQDHADARIETVELGEQLVERLLLLVVAAVRARHAASPFER